MTLEVATPGSEALPTPALDDVLAAIDEPLPAIGGLVVARVRLGSAARLEGLLRATLPNVRHLRLCSLFPQAEQLQAVARGLPELSYVAVVYSAVGTKEALHAFACALSEQRSTSAGCSDGSHCLVLDVVGYAAVAPVSKQRVQHPGVEMRAVWEWNGWKLPRDVLGR